MLYEVITVRDGRGVATTMGFSTLDGLVMGTRCGALDPGVLLYLMREEGLDEPALTDLLYNRSGLFGVSGLSADMRTLLESRITSYNVCYTKLLRGRRFLRRVAKNRPTGSRGQS